MFSTPPKQPSIISVTRLNRLARQVLESEIGQVWVSGELSNFVAASSGHWYFTLKDSKAQIKTAMFKGANRGVKFSPKAGDKVVIRGSLSLYEARGDYQLIGEHMEPEGLGQLKQAYEALKAKLSAEGLFAMEAKQALPTSVKRLGVVTSPTGAAIHDILNVLKRRNPSIEVIIYPSLVQGATAAKSIAEQIHIANIRDEVDLLIVGRGGGSLEDLWAFNEEIVAYAISKSSLPIVSAVGHEVDVTIADYVADMRAPTPSAAAELVSTDKSQLERHIQQQQHRLSQVFEQHLKRIQYKLHLIESRLSNVHPAVQIRQANQHTDNLTMRLSQAINVKLNDAQSKSKNVTLRLQHASPKNAIKDKKQQLQKVSEKLNSIQQRQLSDKRYQLQRIADILNSVSPLSTLSRGYSIAFKNDKVVRSVSQLEKGDVIETRISDGSVIAKIQEITQKQQ
ncbi:exodeoxyribonuclease VII large subunit [Brumicola pallidula]|uniref:Exodeoxyribonuclease 7 large subunit n=1 Tax=Brumicola pallidula DSM 14239 = ACAM 615 TaxID=1121922 RepID=K6YVC5_9ALTE|nr:exodeoxyribonuclease VII large subunit [Glaciecola pallidula]GAC27926.1 exodeoxyribonuclease VII large subunit [Glaciecola pallidula DSM 14239 = ACAM 615]